MTGSSISVWSTIHRNGYRIGAQLMRASQSKMVARVAMNLPTAALAQTGVSEITWFMDRLYIKELPRSFR